MTRQARTQTPKLSRPAPTGFVFGTLVGSSLVGWLLAAPLLDGLGTFLPLGAVALGGYLVLRTQWSR